MKRAPSVVRNPFCSLRIIEESLHRRREGVPVARGEDDDALVRRVLRARLARAAREERDERGRS